MSSKKKEKKEAMKEQRRREAFFKKAATWLIGAVIVAGVGYLIYNSIVPIPQSEREKPVDRVVASDWVKGDPNAEVVLIEYSDFQCPACAAYFPITDQLTEQYGDRIAFAYRHFPLKQIHPNATLAAQAAEAAGLQGKFFEMHDVLFLNQSEWSEGKPRGLFVSYAKDLGLDVGQFKRDLNSKEVRAMVKADYMNALLLKLNSTPSFFLNGEKIDNPNGLDEFTALIDEALGVEPEATESAGNE